ncbi:hypothetical protein HXX76_002954 [Chlamydomonas incerta]|uniref:Uncharacterized protein n=1 Tax=Chlamydomonas incerta TaxID=51695 RepID=A0A835TPJ2_CHLIN|nr:hypothetical protein HXX76_002954 [Chlamydomonas incerta]|eukprot:KAG2442875.1 hypothetical protein HXX76_002954 [Chlamydomonas incerta]
MWLLERREVALEGRCYSHVTGGCSSSSTGGNSAASGDDGGCGLRGGSGRGVDVARLLAAAAGGCELPVLMDLYGQWALGHPPGPPGPLPLPLQQPQQQQQQQQQGLQQGPQGLQGGGVHGAGMDDGAAALAAGPPEGGGAAAGGARPPGARRPRAQLSAWDRVAILAAAAGSCTPCWQLKVGLLAARGCPAAEDVCRAAVLCMRPRPYCYSRHGSLGSSSGSGSDGGGRQGAVQAQRAQAGPAGAEGVLADGDRRRAEAWRAEALRRVVWLRRRGYPVGLTTAKAAAEIGAVELLELLRKEGVGMGWAVAERAAAAGQVAVLEWLHARRCSLGPPETILAAAARRGHTAVLSFLLERAGLLQGCMSVGAGAGGAGASSVGAGADSGAGSWAVGAGAAAGADGGVSARTGEAAFAELAATADAAAHPGAKGAAEAGPGDGPQQLQQLQLQLLLPSSVLVAAAASGSVALLQWVAAYQRRHLPPQPAPTEPGACADAAWKEWVQEWEPAAAALSQTASAAVAQMALGPAAGDWAGGGAANAAAAAAEPPQQQRPPPSSPAAQPQPEPALGSHGWPATALVAAAGSGCEDAVAWVREDGCPADLHGRAYLRAAAACDLAMLRCLHRHRLPACAEAFAEAVAAAWKAEVAALRAGGGSGGGNGDCRRDMGGSGGGGEAGVLVLSWWVEAGLPVDWRVAVEAVAGVSMGTGGDDGDGVRDGVRAWVLQRAAEAAANTVAA